MTDSPADEAAINAILHARIALVQQLGQALVNRAAKGSSLEDVAINALIQSKTTEAMLSGLLQHLANVSTTQGATLETLLNVKAIDAAIDHALEVRIQAFSAPPGPSILVPGQRLNGH
jgi:hypothetical protein